MDARSPRNALTFYSITLALAVAVRLAVPVVGEASLALTMLTPAMAVAVMLAAVSPEGSLRDAARSLGLTTAGLKGWPLAIAGPALIQAAGLAILVAAGLTALAAPEIRGSVPAIALNIMAGFVIGTAFALAEEVGWRGYMLPRLLGWGVVPAMLIVGFLHGVWHLPLMLTTGYYHPSGNPWIVVPLFLVTLTLAGVFFGFLRVWTGSVWPVAIAHAAANTAWGIAAELAHTKSPIVLEYVGGESGAVVIGGLLIVDLVLIGKLRRRGLAAHA
jgi:membrane protease YdiL (CAAX protease family)